MKVHGVESLCDYVGNMIPKKEIIHLPQKAL
jgi:hypothetical protein